MIPKLSKEEVIKNLNIVINGLGLIKERIVNDEPISNNQWYLVAQPFNECMSYLLNYPKVVRVRKKSGKPFKSGLLVNTIKDITVNQKDPKKRHAYVFYEDDSIVNVDKCEIVNI